MARPRLRTACLLAGWCALLAVIACEDNVPGIYHTLATESQRDNRNLHDDLTVSAVASVGGQYYVAAHGLWSRPAGRESWQEVRRPRSGSTEMAVLAMAQSGATLCVGTEDGVYHADADPQAPGWQEAAGIAGQVLRLFAIPSAEGGSESEILAISQPAGLYVSDDGCRSFARVTLPGDATESGRPFDAFHDGQSYWLTVGTRVYTGSVPSLAGLARDERAPERAEYRGIWCVGVGQCYFATHDGEIYKRDSNNWELLGKIKPPDDETPTVPLTLFHQIGDQILIGARGYGFYQFSERDLDLDDVQRGPRSTSQLYRAHVTVFVRHGDLLFAGTAGDGLSSIEVATAAKDTGTWDWE